MEQAGITKPEIEKIKEEQNLASFVISPLFPGYGITLGNSLRRILFSSLSGAAIYSLKISGVSHEFSTIPGIKEDVIKIILNLKQIRLKLHEGDQATLKLKIKGPKVVLAKDIKVPASVEIVNPNLEIANLSKSGKLNMEMRVNRGFGYIPVELREEKKEEPLGTILIDANYSPIVAVNFNIDRTRVGKMTNYDKLTIDIETDGTIKPEEALKTASKILVEQFDFISKFKTKDSQKISSVSALKISAKKLKNLKIEDANFSGRTANALINNRIKTMAGLARLSDEKLNQLKGLGEKGIEEIKTKLKKFE